MVKIEQSQMSARAKSTPNVTPACVRYCIHNIQVYNIQYTIFIRDSRMPRVLKNNKQTHASSVHQRLKVRHYSSKRREGLGLAERDCLGANNRAVVPEHVHVEKQRRHTCLPVGAATTVVAETSTK